MLNTKQALAVNSPSETPTLVLAGAGSGKTTVMAQRIVKLFDRDGIPAHKILGVTFTKKAAKELADRVTQIDPRFEAGFGGRGQSGALISTFHGASLQILRRLFAQHDLFLPRRMDKWTIIDTADQKKIVKDLCKKHPAIDGLFESTKDQIQAVISFIGRNKQNMKRHKNIDDTFFKEGTQYCNMIYGHYENLCYQQSLLDFDEIMLCVVEMMRDHTEIRERVASWFDHLLCDEYQDCNDVQELFLKLILNGRLSITTVGDDDQSIYGWRGARSELILGFAKRYGTSTNVVTLEQNYRSSKNILNAANKIIVNNEERHAKELFSDGVDGNPVAYEEYVNVWQEAEGVAEKISTDLQSGLNPNDIAVLFRGNAQTQPLESCFTRAGIAYRMTGGLNFWERKEVKAVMSYARLAINPMDPAAFGVACSTPRRGIGEKKENQLQYRVASEGITFSEALIEESSSKFKLFGEMLAKLEALKDTVPLETFFQYILDDCGVLEFYRKNDFDKSESRVDNLNALISFAEMSPDNLTLDEFCEQAALTAEGSKNGNENDAVALSTVHGAKGLEWSKVYIIGMRDGMFPHGRAVAEGSIEEERRLAYVAFTRAKHDLEVSYPVFDNQGERGPVSRFIRESGILS